MREATPLSQNNRLSIDILFTLILLAYAVLGWFLVWHIPYTFPFGGPDELMHLSMADYIAKHLAWPQWDSTEVVRNAYGVSYSSGGSMVYWLHGLSYRLFGEHRIGAFILLLLYLALSIWAYRKNTIAGFLMLAGMLPQTLFIFSYVNSDGGTIITALLLGMSVGFYVTGERKPAHFMLFFFFAGLAVTARQHLWAIAFLTFVWTLVYTRRTWLNYPKKFWLFALLLALLPASWWFITSYLANAGDILGVFINAKSIAKFGDPDLPSLARAWSDIQLSDFLPATLVSLYGSFGWTSLPLKPYEYFSAAAVIIAITILLYRKIDKPLFFFFVLLVSANLGFMLVYSTFYDYQPQGRYLFPSIYIVLGMITTIAIEKKLFSKLLLALLILLSLQNVYFSTKLSLFSYVDDLLEKPTRLAALPSKKYALALHHIDRLKVVDDKLFLKGWIFDRQAGKPFPVTKLILLKDGQAYAITLEKRERPDVAAAFQNPALDMAGVGADMIGVKQLPRGIYDVMFMVTVNGEPQVIPLEETVKL